MTYLIPEDARHFRAALSTAAIGALEIAAAISRALRRPRFFRTFNRDELRLQRTTMKDAKSYADWVWRDHRQIEETVHSRAKGYPIQRAAKADDADANVTQISGKRRAAK